MWVTVGAGGGTRIVVNGDRRGFRHSDGTESGAVAPPPREGTGWWPNRDTGEPSDGTGSTASAGGRRVPPAETRSAAAALCHGLTGPNTSVVGFFYGPTLTALPPLRLVVDQIGRAAIPPLSASAKSGQPATGDIDEDCDRAVVWIPSTIPTPL